MYVKNIKSIITKIDRYTSCEDVNCTIADSILASIDECSSLDVESLTSYAQKLQKEYLSKNKECSDEMALTLALIDTFLDSYEGDDDLPQDVIDEIGRHGKVLDKVEFEANPFLQNVKFTDKTVDPYKFTHAEIGAYEPVIYKEVVTMSPSYSIPCIGLFKDEAKSLAITVGDDETYMSIGPFEMNSMAHVIEHVRGKVLCLGLGMGYFAYMSALKDNVQKVTVVENDHDLIELFKQEILPQFKYTDEKGNSVDLKDKIEIVEADAYVYADALTDGMFDSVFANLWSDDTQSLDYIKLKGICKKFKKTHVDYHLEKSIGLAITVNVLMDMMFSLSKHAQEDDQITPNLEDEEKELYEFVQKLLKKVKVTEPEMVDKYLNYKNILKMI